MSTSLIYQLWGIRDCNLLAVRYENNSVSFVVEYKQSYIRCPECGSKNIIKRGCNQRVFRTIPVACKRVDVLLKQQRIQCKDCDALCKIQPEFAKVGKHHTKRFARYILELLKVMNINDVANHLGVSWTFVKNIQKEYLRNNYGKPPLKNVRYIGIDEVNIGKGHRYLTIVLNLQTGVVLFVGEGRGADALKPFWKRIKRCRANVEAVSIDMSPAYISAVSENLVGASIIFDHFHIIKMMNDKLSKLRRSLYNELTEYMDKKVLKGTRWLLLKNPENLNPDKGESTRLAEALELNAPLAMAYYMKEDLRQIWNQESKAVACKVLDSWIERALSSEIRILQEMGKSLQKHKSGILNWYDYPLSNGALEGTNNKIGLIQRQSYGIRDHEFLKLKIYACKTVKYRLVG